MPLIDCPDCGKSVSDKADSCNNCGCPLGDSGGEAQEKPRRQSTARSAARSNEGKEVDIEDGVVAAAAIIVYGFLTLVTFLGVYIKAPATIATLDVHPALGGFIASLPFSSFLFLALVTKFTTQFKLTNRRVIARTGLLATKSCDIKLSKIESVQVSRGLWGAIFNYGTVTVRGTGGVRSHFIFLSAPEQLRIAISKTIDNHEDARL
jgi:hypothetical protein